jgi:hypothetical protein
MVVEQLVPSRSFKLRLPSLRNRLRLCSRGSKYRKSLLVALSLARTMFFGKIYITLNRDPMFS